MARYAGMMISIQERHAMQTIDFKTDPAMFYNATAKSVQVVDVPPRHYLMIDGTGDPNTSGAYKAAVEALYTVAYTLRAALKAGTGIAYTVMPLEGLWQVREGGDFDDRADWLWTMMIFQPDGVTAELFAQAKLAARKKKPELAATIDAMRLERLHEGLSVQILHVGPYATEPETLAKIMAFCEANGYLQNGRHHEIYLSDPRKITPEKMKTILREPVR